MCMTKTKILLDELQSKMFKNSQYIHASDRTSVEIYINVPIYINSQQIG